MYLKGVKSKRREREKAEWKWHQNIIPCTGRAVSQQRQKWLKIPYFAVEETYLEWETIFPGSHRCKPGRARTRTQVSCSPGQESAAVYNWGSFVSIHRLIYRCLLCAHMTEVTLKWDGNLRLRNNGMNITARVTNHHGLSGTWDEFSGHGYLSAKTRKVLGKRGWVGHSKLTRYKIHIQLSWDLKICQSTLGVERRHRRCRVVISCFPGKTEATGACWSSSTLTLTFPSLSPH